MVKLHFTPEHGTKSQKGGKELLYSFLNLGARWSEWSLPRPGYFTMGEDPVPIAWEPDWTPEPLWMCA